MFDNDLMFDDAEVINEPGDTTHDEDGFVINDEIDNLRNDLDRDEDEDA